MEYRVQRHPVTSERCQLQSFTFRNPIDWDVPTDTFNADLGVSCLVAKAGVTQANSRLLLANYSEPVVQSNTTT
eukprot:2197430-Rhodomonas_salina.1